MALQAGPFGIYIANGGDAIGDSLREARDIARRDGAVVPISHSGIKIAVAADSPLDLQARDWHRAHAGCLGVADVHIPAYPRVELSSQDCFLDDAVKLARQALFKLQMAASENYSRER